MMVEHIGDATLYCGDCLEIMPTLGNVDAVVTDPPYGINYQSGKRSDKFEHIIGDNRIGWKWLRVLPHAEVAVVFSHWKTIGSLQNALSNIITPRGCIVWQKLGGGIGDLRRSYITDYELILYGSTDKWRLPGVRHGSIWCAPKCDVNSYVHPTQKPQSIMQLCVDRFSSLNNLILDPFMGSGTTGVACAQLGRQFIGIEIDEKYFDIACQRIEEAQRQGRLFEPEPTPKPEQKNLLT